MPAIYLTQAFTDWFGATPTASSQGDKGKRVLLVDDSPFFRNLLTPLLSVAGYDVTTVDSADRALGLCEAGNDFDVIISDIEMPGMDGFQFASAVRAAGRWQNTPMVALSSHATPKDLDRGRAAGFSDYVAKFDRDALLHTLSRSAQRCKEVPHEPAIRATRAARSRGDDQSRVRLDHRRRPALRHSRAAGAGRARAAAHHPHSAGAARRSPAR